MVRVSTAALLFSTKVFKICTCSFRGLSWNMAGEKPIYLFIHRMSESANIARWIARVEACPLICYCSLNILLFKGVRKQHDGKRQGKPTIMCKWQAGSIMSRFIGKRCGQLRAAPRMDCISFIKVLLFLVRDSMRLWPYALTYFEYAQLNDKSSVDRCIL